MWWYKVPINGSDSAMGNRGRFLSCARSKRGRELRQRTEELSRERERGRAITVNGACAESRWLVQRSCKRRSSVRFNRLQSGEGERGTESAVAVTREFRALMERKGRNLHTAHCCTMQCASTGGECCLYSSINKPGAKDSATSHQSFDDLSALNTLAVARCSIRGCSQDLNERVPGSIKSVPRLSLRGTTLINLLTLPL